MESYKTKFGKILFVISIILALYLFFSPLNKLIFTIDEYFTLVLIKFPLMQCITITANDVHPPLYYILIKLFMKILNILNINYDLIYISKLVSIIPYLIILILGGTYVKKEYSWLTAGLSTFTLITMSEFFISYLTMRMYSWGCLLLLLSFISLKGVIFKSNKKYWFLFTIFSVLGAYTHYFVALSLFLLYLFLLGHILFNKNKSDFKKLILSIIVMVILYVPWLSTLITQLSNVHQNYWIPQINLAYLLNCINFFVSFKEYSYPSDILVQLFLLTSLIILLIIIIKECISSKNNETYYIFCGVSLFICTIFVGIILSLTFKPILQCRYLLPSVAVFWFSVSIFIGKLQNTKLLIILLSLILALSGFSFMDTMEINQGNYDNAILENNVFNEIKSNNNNIVLTSASGFLQFGTIINNSNVFTDVKNEYGLNEKEKHAIFDYTLVSSTKFKYIVKENKDKLIYVIEPNWSKLDLGENVTLIQLHKIPRSEFIIYIIH